MDKLDCSGCTECCNWMTFMLNPPADLYKKYSEFYQKRGCKITTQPGIMAVTVPSPCPNLVPNGCRIQNIGKPQMCKEYDCRTDPFLKGGKYYGSREKK